MMTYVIGGSKCGKSTYAEKILDSFTGKKYYVATMIPYGDEAYAAIECHRKMRRNRGFETIEKYTDIDEISLPENSVVLLECLGNLCANEMFRNEKVTDPTEKIVTGIERLKTHTRELVVVTNSVSDDGIIYPSETMEYMRVMNVINRRLSEKADNVIECVFGIQFPLKGELL